MTDRQALLVGDVLATGYWAARISEITEEDTVLIIGAGPTGICTLLCVMLKKPQRIIVCEKDPGRIRFLQEQYPDVLTVTPEECAAFVQANSAHGGADVVLEVAGASSTFRLAWECARPNAIVTVVALYDTAQTLPLPEMYGKKPDLQDGRCRWLRLRGNAAPHRRGQAEYRAAHHPHLPPEQDRGGLRSV